MKTALRNQNIAGRYRINRDECARFFANVTMLVLTVVVASATAASPNESPASGPPSVVVPPESKALLDRLPGELVLQATYKHRSRGQDFGIPSMLSVKKTADGTAIAATYMPTMNTTYIAYTKGDQLSRYEVHGHGHDGTPPYAQLIECGKGTATVTYRGGDKDGQEDTLTIPPDARFQPNSRPDPYAALMAEMFGTQPLESKEDAWYDWDNTGRGMASYNSRIEYKGEEQVVVPAGTFTAHHYVETQTTFGDTWFKKRPDQVTEYWVLANGVTVRILRQREPYELLLETVDSPAALPGVVELSKTANPLAIAEPPTGHAMVSVSVINTTTSVPLPGVYVFATGGPNRAIQQSGVADAKGTFVFNALPPGQYTICSSKPKGFTGGGRGSVSLDSDTSTADVTLKLDQGIRISGTVIDLESKPVANAKVRARSWDQGGSNFSSDEVTTNAEAAYEIAGVPRGGAYRLFVAAEGYYPGFRDVSADGDMKDIAFTMGKGATVSGHAVDSAGNPVRDANIALEPDFTAWRQKEGDMTPLWGVPIALGDDGSFTFENVAPGKYRYHLRARSENQSFEQTSEGDWLDVALGAAITDAKAMFPDTESERIEGTVRDETGAPVANVNVDAITYEGVHWNAKTDAEGRYKLVGLGDHTFDIYFMHDVLPDVRLHMVRPGAFNADVVMPHPGRIRGLVLDAATGKPVTQGNVEIVWHVPEHGLERGYRSQRQSGSIKQDGSFDLDRVLPGTVYLKVSAPGYLEQQTASVSVKAGETSDNMKVRLTPAAIVEGNVLANGKPLDVEQGIQVTCLDEPIHDVPAGYIIHEGKYRLDRLPSGNYQITAWARGRGHMADEKKTVQVAPGQVLRLDFQLDFPPPKPSP